MTVGDKENNPSVSIINWGNKSLRGETVHTTTCKEEEKKTNSGGFLSGHILPSFHVRQNISSLLSKGFPVKTKNALKAAVEEHHMYGKHVWPRWKISNIGRMLSLHLKCRGAERRKPARKHHKERALSGLLKLQERKKRVCLRCLILRKGTWECQLSSQIVFIFSKSFIQGRNAH